MGNKGAKKTNQMLEKQTNLANTAGNTFGDRSSNEYDYRTGLRDQIGNEYWKLYNGEVDDGYGGGGGNPAANVRMNEAMGTARDVMNNGLWNDQQKAEYMAQTGAVVPGFMQGLRNNMSRANAATGGYSGYNTQTAKLARDAARQGFQANLEAKSGMEKDIRDRRMSGVGMVGGFDTEYMNRLREAQNQANAAARAGAGRKEDYLRSLTGLMGGAEDLQYGQMQLGGYGQGMQGVNSRVNETPQWQQMAMGLVPAAANAALGIWGGGGGQKKPGTNYGDLRGEGGAY